MPVARAGPAAPARPSAAPALTVRPVRFPAVAMPPPPAASAAWPASAAAAGAAPPSPLAAPSTKPRAAQAVAAAAPNRYRRPPGRATMTGVLLKPIGSCDRERRWRYPLTREHGPPESLFIIKKD